MTNTSVIASGAKQSRRVRTDSDGLRRDCFAPLAMTLFMTELRSEKHKAVPTSYFYKYPFALISSALKIPPPAAPRIVLCERAINR